MFLFAFLPFIADAQDRSDIHLHDGTVYANARIADSTSTQLVVINKDGVFTINKALLSPEDRIKFKYDENAVAAEASKKLLVEVEKKNAVIKAEAVKRLLFLPKDYGGISVQHETYIEIKESEERRLRNLNKSEEEIRLAGSDQSKGGRLIVRIERGTIGAANTKYFTVIVFDADGKEVQRKEGTDDIPSLPIGDGGWRNLLIVHLLECKRPITVRVVDELLNHKCEFQSQ